MDYEVKSFAHIFKAKGAETVINSGKINVEVYNLEPNTSVHIWFEPVDIENKAENHLIVVEGQVEVRYHGERLVISAGEIFSAYGQESYSIYALLPSKLMSANNMKYGEMEDRHDQLSEFVKEVEQRDQYLRGHNIRVARYTTLILQVLAPEFKVADVFSAALCHDIGKMKISSDILNKPGRLTKEEFEEIKKHPIYSDEILREQCGEQVAKLARWHHEKPDGSGYPDGLKGDEIPIECRVMAVADVFDALTTTRSYRKRFSFHEALVIMQEDVVHQRLDAKAFHVLEKLVHEGKIVEGIENMVMDDRTWEK